MTRWKGEHPNKFRLERAVLGSVVFSITASVQMCSGMDFVKEAQVHNVDILSDAQDPC